MNARMERVMNSKNLGTRIRGNGALDREIWALEVFRGKLVISGCDRMPLGRGWSTRISLSDFR
jgi:hypothetical protein